VESLGFLSIFNSTYIYTIGMCCILFAAVMSSIRSVATRALKGVNIWTIAFFYGFIATICASIAVAFNIAQYLYTGEGRLPLVFDNI
jgi:hypothetical protein